MASVVGSLASTAFTSIYEALTGISDDSNLIGIVDAHEDRLTTMENALGQIRYTSWPTSN